MKKEVDIYKAPGKKLLAFTPSVTSNQAILTWDDDTFSTLGIQFGYGRGGKFIDGDPLEIWAFNKESLFMSGVTTEQEYEKARQTLAMPEQKRAKEKAEDEERETYRRLKAKYEPTDWI